MASCLWKQWAVQNGQREVVVENKDWPTIMTKTHQRFSPLDELVWLPSSTLSHRANRAELHVFYICLVFTSFPKRLRLGEQLW